MVSTLSSVSTIQVLEARDYQHSKAFGGVPGSPHDCMETGSFLFASYRSRPTGNMQESIATYLHPSTSPVRTVLLMRTGSRTHLESKAKRKNGQSERPVQTACTVSRTVVLLRLVDGQASSKQQNPAASHARLRASLTCLQVSTTVDSTDID